jgi:subtilase family serine protease
MTAANDSSSQSPAGFAPYCKSTGVFCYTPGFLKKAYDFPPTNGPNGLDGSGQTIVIVDAFGSPTLQSDLNVYDAALGLPPVNVTILCGPTWTGAATDHCPRIVPGSAADKQCGELGWAFETTLDVTMAHALAPGAKIVVAIANDCSDPSVYAAEHAVVTQPELQGSVMSQSFGEPDYIAGCSSTTPPVGCPGVNSTVVDFADRTYWIATQNAWTLVASSGDDGATTDFSASNQTDTTLTPSWPSTSPLNLGVGGTEGSPYGGQYPIPLPPHAHCPEDTTCNTGLVIVNGGQAGCGHGNTTLLPSRCIPVGYGGESAWDEFNFFGVGTATGGGVSAIYDRPSYQDGLPHSFTTLLGAQVRTNGRMSPDVSFNAAINGGLLNYDGFVSLFGGQNGVYVLGGTSAAAPAWAAIVALLDQNVGHPVGFVNPAIYSLAESPWYGNVFHDITQGNNSDTGGRSGVDGFTAAPGYDLTTGWGTPDVAHFITGMTSECQQSH